MKFLSSVLLVSPLAIFGGRLQSNADAPGIRKLQEKGASGCFKCEKKNHVCNTTSNTADCTEFEFNSGNGTFKLKSATLKNQCLDRHAEGFGIWDCVKANANQIFEKKGKDEHCCMSRGRYCVDDAPTPSPTPRPTPRPTPSPTPRSFSLNLAVAGDCGEWDTAACKWTEKWGCPGGKRGTDGFSEDDATKGHACCCGGVSQCLKCAKNGTKCVAATKTADCTKFQFVSGLLKVKAKPDLCLDMFSMNHFGLWSCGKGTNKNQISIEEGKKHCFTSRGRICVQDPSSSIKLHEGASKCLVCEKKDKLCRALSNKADCTEFQMDSDGLFRVKGATLKDQCLDRYPNGFGLWKCDKKNTNQQSQETALTAEGGKYCFTRDGKQHCLTM